MAFGDAGSYARFMGRFSEPLAPLFAELVTAAAGDDVLDVGCGPGVLTEVLVEQYGVEHVTAIDPTPGFVEAARRRLPGVDVRQGTAEDLPFADGSFDAAFAQLVVHFMKDPVRGLAEMVRVTRPGGVVAACVWDHPGLRGPLTPFWSTVAEASTRVAWPRHRPARTPETWSDASPMPAWTRSPAASCRSLSTSSRSRNGGRRTPSQLGRWVTTWRRGRRNRSRRSRADAGSGSATDRST